MNAVLNCYALIESAIRTAGDHKPDDYVFVFSKANKPLRRQERWELLRTLRTDDNEVKAKFYQGELDALSHAFDAIGQAYDVARADIVPIELPGCERATPITVACELLRSVIAWHHGDAGYWNNFPRATTDEEASEARVQLEESDSHYPISKAMANRLLEALDGERSHVLRHIAVALPQAEEITRTDLLKMMDITIQALTYRIKNVGFPKPIRVEGRKAWFDVSAVDKWRESNRKHSK